MKEILLIDWMLQPWYGYLFSIDFFLLLIFLTATLQAAHGLPSNAAQAVRFNSMMVPVQDPVRHPQTLPLHSQYSTATTSVDSKIVTAFDRKQLVKGILIIDSLECCMVFIYHYASHRSLNK